MDDATIVIYTERLLEALNTFEDSGISAEVTLKRIGHLLRWNLEQARTNMDAKIDAMERELNL